MVGHKEDDFKKFAGSMVCANCHKDIYQKHLLTEHHLTSSTINSKNVIGSFENGKNVFHFSPFVNVKMEQRDSGYFQVEYNNGVEVKNGRFDMVIGSGRKGQSYLSWVRNRLVQLPITYFTPAQAWSNSPGYNPHVPMFNRPITSRCLECHSTYFERISDSSQRLEAFDHNKIIFGVDCERCHGPGADHVEFQTKNPAVKTAKYIVNPGKLSRERLLDLCSLCHGGALTKTKPSFSFVAGDTLSNYFRLQTAMWNADNIDVHGNQFGLLALSKCFVNSKLTCVTCHNVHENEDGKIETFSQRCVTCHSDSHGKVCKLTAAIGPTITQNCIDCHMPKQMSHAVAVYLQGDDVPTSAWMRTHYIKIYSDESQRFLNQLKQSRQKTKK
ncbi:MAG: multiheme c-type cytochrome [Flavisolibacter sp.]